MICSTTASDDNLNQAGGFLEYGRADDEIPLPCGKLVSIKIQMGSK